MHYVAVLTTNQRASMNTRFNGAAESPWTLPSTLANKRLYDTASPPALALVDTAFSDGLAQTLLSNAPNGMTAATLKTADLQNQMHAGLQDILKDLGSEKLASTIGGGHSPITATASSHNRSNSFGDPTTEALNEISKPTLNEGQRKALVKQMCDEVQQQYKDMLDRGSGMTLTRTAATTQGKLMGDQFDRILPFFQIIHKVMQLHADLYKKESFTEQRCMGMLTEILQACCTDKVPKYAKEHRHIDVAPNRYLATVLHQWRQDNPIDEISLTERTQQATRRQLDFSSEWTRAGSSVLEAVRALPTIEYIAAQFQKAYGVTFTYNDVKGEIIHHHSLVSFEQLAVSTDALNQSDNLYQVIANLAERLDEHETSDQRDKSSGQRSEEERARMKYSETSAGSKTLLDAAEYLAAMAIARIEFQIEQIPATEHGKKRNLKEVWSIVSQKVKYVANIRELYLQHYRATQAWTVPQDDAQQAAPARSIRRLREAAPSSDGWNAKQPDRNANYVVTIDPNTQQTQLHTPLFTLDAVTWLLNSPDAMPQSHECPNGVQTWTGSLLEFLRSNQVHGFGVERFAREPTITEEQIQARLRAPPKPKPAPKTSQQGAQQRTQNQRRTDPKDGIGAVIPQGHRQYTREQQNKLREACREASKEGAQWLAQHIQAKYKLDAETATGLARGLYKPIQCRYCLGAPTIIHPAAFKTIHVLYGRLHESGTGICQVCYRGEIDSDGNAKPVNHKLSDCPKMKTYLREDKAGKSFPLPDDNRAEIARKSSLDPKAKERAWTCYKPRNGVYPTEETRDSYDFSSENIGVNSPKQWRRLCDAVAAETSSDDLSCYEGCGGKSGRGPSSTPKAAAGSNKTQDYLKSSAFKDQIKAALSNNENIAFQAVVDKGISFVQSMQITEDGTVSEADKQRAAEAGLRVFAPDAVPEEAQDDPFVLGAKEHQAAPGTRIAAIASNLKGTVSKSKSKNRGPATGKIQKAVVKQYAQNGIFAIYVPYATGLSTGGSSETQVGNNGSLMYLGQDSSVEESPFQ